MIRDLGFCMPPQKLYSGSGVIDGVVFVVLASVFSWAIRLFLGSLLVIFGGLCSCLTLSLEVVF
jgi:hypothetical protein